MSIGKVQIVCHLSLIYEVLLNYMILFHCGVSYNLFGQIILRLAVDVEKESKRMKTLPKIVMKVHISTAVFYNSKKRNVVTR